MEGARGDIGKREQPILVRLYLQTQRLAFTRELHYGSGNVNSGLINNLAADASRLVRCVLLPTGGSLCSLRVSQRTLRCLVHRLLRPCGKAAKQHWQAQPNPLSEAKNQALFRRNGHFLLSPPASRLVVRFDAPAAL